MTEPDTVVRFDELPRLPGSGVGHSWHVYGPGDRERRYEFLFTSVPLNVAGAVGSPANAVTIL